MLHAAFVVSLFVNTKSHAAMSVSLFANIGVCVCVCVCVCEDRGHMLACQCDTDMPACDICLHTSLCLNTDAKCYHVSVTICNIGATKNNRLFLRLLVLLK